MTFAPSYLSMHRNGELKKRGDDLWDRMKQCNLCPRECGANRLDGKRGICGASATLDVSSHHPHFGEEDPLVGSGGSGTIFMTHCSLRCVFCINADISQGGSGRPHSIDALADMMLELQGIGCLNINTVTPTHYSPHIVKALDIAASKGLNLPLVYNTCGWEKLDVLRVLDGIVDIYLPDFKYASSDMAATYSEGADTYPELTQKALIEMNRQVGVAKPNTEGVMERGLMIRHLVMPNDVSGTPKVLQWIASNLPKNTFVNLMSQYRPAHKAHSYEPISRRITRGEYHEAVETARQLGLTNVEIQGYPRGLL